MTVHSKSVQRRYNRYVGDGLGSKKEIFFGMKRMGMQRNGRVVRASEAGFFLCTAICVNSRVIESLPI